MESVVGIFRSTEDASRAYSALADLGSTRENVTVLCSGTSAQNVEERVTTSDTESPGMGEALGGTVGGAVGAATGTTLGLAAASFFLPGVGPVLAAGVLGAAIVGAGGAAVGVAAGDA